MLSNSVLARLLSNAPIARLLSNTSAPSSAYSRNGDGADMVTCEAGTVTCH